MTVFAPHRSRATTKLLAASFHSSEEILSRTSFNVKFNKVGLSTGGTCLQILQISQFHDQTFIIKCQQKISYPVFIPTAQQL